MKSFGNDTPDVVERQEFELKYLVDEEMKSQTFGIIPRMSGGDLAGMAWSNKVDPEQSASRMINLISKLADNRDGDVKAKWEFKPAVQKPGDDRPMFRGPDGELYPMEDSDALLELWNDHSTWTSRRRWQHLMNQDDEAIVNLADIVKVVEWVIGLAADRPTQPQS